MMTAAGRSSPLPDEASFPAPASRPPFELAAGLVHVVHLALEGVEVGRLLGLLAAEERERAARFRAEEAGRQFVATRAALRVLLARCLGTAPGALVLRSGPRGKPELDAPAPRFNVAHGGARALLAFAAGRAVGVDVERAGSVDPAALAVEVLAPPELARWARLPPARRGDAFLQLWTAKEALLKAWGCGLSVPPASLELRPVPPAVGEVPGAPPDPLAPAGGWWHGGLPAAAEAGGWRVRPLPVAPGYAAAVAAAGEDWRVAAWEIDPAALARGEAVLAAR